MSDSEEVERTYRVENHQFVQGQVIGDKNIIHQYFGSPNAISPGHAAAPSLPEHIWSIPYPRNPVFTGREHLLTQLANALKPGEVVALAQPQVQAISGLGGIGKTQLAVEYAYRHHQDYQAVFWIRADTADALIEGYGEVALLLHLPEKDEQDQSRVVKAVQEWLRTQTGWLLILDNVDELALVRTFLPPSFGGHILLTTREQAMGKLAIRIAVDTMDQEVGALLLLRRAGLIAANASLEMALPSDLTLARVITEEFGGLPLALDQAGAYIEETQCNLEQYLLRYRTQQKILLQRRGNDGIDHPDTVATTWSLAFTQVEHRNLQAADVLRFCAFLHPDSIPESFFLTGASCLGPYLSVVAKEPLVLDEAIAVLRAYSLVHRDMSKQAISVHRLVQTVLKQAMREDEQKEWAERTTRAVKEALPSVTFTTWEKCEQWLPHAQMCITLSEETMLQSTEKFDVAHWAGTYLLERYRIQEAEPFLQQALTWRVDYLGPEHIETAVTLDRLARWFELQGKYEEAEPLYQRALKIREQELGETHLLTASNLNNLAGLYYVRGKYREAEPLYQRALTIYEQDLGEAHLSTASSLNNLALLYDTQGKYEEAEPLYQRALKIGEQALGETHPETAMILSNLAELYRTLEKYKEAEPLHQRALKIREQVLGETHPETAVSLNNLALLYYAQRKYEEAEPLYQRALKIQEQALGETHPNIAVSLNNLALLYYAQRKYEEAEPLYQRAGTINTKIYGAEHPAVAIDLNNLAELYCAQGKYEEAELLCQRALKIYRQALGEIHLSTAAVLNNLAGLYWHQERYEEADLLYQRALKIYEQLLGKAHLSTAAILNSLAESYGSQERYEEADLLYQRVLKIYEQALGADHPDTRSIHRNHDKLLFLQLMGHSEEIMEPDQEEPALFKFNANIKRRKKHSKHRGRR